MLQFHLSKPACKLLKRHLSVKPQGPMAGAMQWYLHSLVIQGKDCLIAMEEDSRYAMIFAGLSEQDLEFFPDKFQDRLWRESCEIIGGEDTTTISNVILNTSVEQLFQKGHNRSVSAHINDVAWQLESIAMDVGRLPEGRDECFAVGVSTNEMLRKRKTDKDYFRPFERFRSKLESLVQLEAHQAALPDNVVSLEAERRKRLI